MNEQQFTELLKKLKIPTNNRSYADIFDLLDAKLSEYLDRQDEASQALVDDIQDALDYAEIKKNEVGSGIALKREEEPKSEGKADISELRDATEKAHREKEQVDSVNGQVPSQGQQVTPQPQAQGQNIAGQQAGKLWFSSVNGADNINTMFFQALDDLKYGEFDHAKSIFEAILQVEPNNASAYLGKLMAIHQIKELRGIGNSYDKDLFSDINMRRAYDHGNDQQKKYLDDAKKEVESGKKYKEADRKAQDVNNESAQMEAAQMFAALGTYRDAAQRKEQCVERIKEIKYNNALAINKRAYTAADYRKAAALYREVAGFKNADNLAKDCEEFAKRRDEEEAEDKRKDDLKATFLKLKSDFDAEEKVQRELFKKAFNSMIPISPEPNIARLQECLEAMKKFAWDNPEVTNLAAAPTHISASEKAMAEIAKLAKEYEELQGFKKKEGKSDRFWIVAVLAALLLAGYPAKYGDSVRSVMTYLPIHVTGEYLSVNNAKSPYIFSLSNIESLSLTESDDVKEVVLPNANLSKVYLTGGDYSYIKWPNSVKLMGLREVTGATIPDSVEELSLLHGTIENVEIPSSVKTLSVNSDAITELSLPEGIENLDIGNDCRMKELVVPSTVKDFFIDYASVESITLKEGVTTAKLDRMPVLKELNLPSSLQTLELSLMYELEELTIPEGVVSVTIRQSGSINTIHMPSTLREIWLYDTMSFESIAFPENVQNVYIENNETIKEIAHSENTMVSIRGCANLEDR